MGKASRWFRALLGSKKSSPGSPKAKKSGLDSARNSGGVSRGTHCHGNGGDASPPNSYPSESLDANKHAIAVAAATAAVAEAALAAAQAAAEVVRLTSGNRTSAAYVTTSSSSDRRREWAAVKIQSEFRAYLARRALRALKGLVKLQALVRGRIVRRQSAEMLRRMQAMARIQARACANRSLVSDGSHSHINSSKIHHRGSSSLSKFDYLQQHSSSSTHGSNLKRCYSKSNNAENMSRGRMDVGSKWLDHWMEEYARNNSYLLNIGRENDDGEKSDKILEIDNGQGSRTYSRQSSNNLKKPNPASLSSGEVSSSCQSIKFPQEGKWMVDQRPSAGFQSSSRHGGSSRSQRGGGPFSPHRSECNRSMCFSDFPNYMANTQSSSAKVRSHSAPRQRMHQKLVAGLRDTDTVSERSWSIHGNFMGKGYTGSGHIVMRTH